MSYEGIYSKRCWIDNQLQEATVFIQDGIIARIEFGDHRAPGILDGNNAVLMPGCIDAHVHVNEPGRTDWEGFETATKAAAAGGTTTIVDMPLNATPVTVNVAAFEQKIKASENQMYVSVGFYGGLVPGNAAQMEPLANAGVLGIKAFLTHSGIDDFPNATAADLDAAMPMLAKLKLPLLAHCELDEVGTKAALEADPRSYAAWLASRPKEWENKAVAWMIELCRKHKCPVHIVHVSSAEALPLIAAAKKEGLPITAETCTHYLFFEAESIPDGETHVQMRPTDS
jgi:allantoinase